MEENDENLYRIPPNYTDSGKFLGGMISGRNAVETLLSVMMLGFTEYKFLPISGSVKVVIMAITLIPLAVVMAIGFDGDSVIQYLTRIAKWVLKRRKIVRGTNK